LRSVLYCEIGEDMLPAITLKKIPRSALSSCRLHFSGAYPHPTRLQGIGQPLIRYTQLPSRSLIEVGPDADDARTFIHGLITANTKSLQYTSSGYYTAFLNAGGRVLDDVFIYPPPSNFERGTGGLRGQDEPYQYLIEVDTERANALMKHLKKHKLRRKLSFRLLDQEEGPVYAIWTDERNLDPFTVLKPTLEPLRSWKLDQRPNMGARCVLRSNIEMEQFFGPPNASFENYTVHRMINGIAEGSAEIFPTAALPQESNLDLLGGIDFRKGCYLGQELTIRTHHTGIVRKRILPVQLYDVNSSKPAPSETPQYIPTANLSLPSRESNISKVGGRKGRFAGKWLAGVGNIGLALCRLEMMTDIRLTEETAPYNLEQEFTVAGDGESGDGQSTELKIKAFVPHWMRLGIEKRLKSLQRDRT
jgi:folate-binding protein YgfZ